MLWLPCSCCLWKKSYEIWWCETCQALLKELWKFEGFSRELLCLGTLLEDVDGVEMPTWMLCNSWPYRKEHFLFHKVTERHLSWCLGRLCLKVWAAWRLPFALSPDICAMSVCLQTCRPVYTPCMSVCLCVVCMEIYMVCVCYILYMCHMPHIWDFFISPYIYIERALRFYLCTCYDKSVFEKWVFSAAAFSLNSNTDAWQ